MTTVPGLGNRSFAQSLIAHFRSFQKSECVIALFVALCKGANERSLFVSLDLKERLCDFPHNRFFQKSDKKNNRTIALSKRAKE